jgi:hypothetical protein
MLNQFASALYLAEFHNNWIKKTGWFSWDLLNQMGSCTAFTFKGGRIKYINGKSGDKASNVKLRRKIGNWWR